MVDTEIANIALTHLGVGKEIANLSTDSSREAVAVRRVFNLTRDAVLRDFDWPFARKRTTLSLVEEEPNDEWGYSYRYPNDCLALRRIFSGIRNDTRQSRVPFELVQDSTGTLIYTDMEQAIIRYTARVVNPTFFHPDFCFALSARIAAYVAPQLTGGDPFELGNRAFKLYTLEIEKAWANAANEEQPEQLPESEFIRAREGGSASDPFEDD